MSESTVLAALHPDAKDLFNVDCNLRQGACARWRAPTHSPTQPTPPLYSPHPPEGEGEVNYGERGERGERSGGTVGQRESASRRRRDRAVTTACRRRARCVAVVEELKADPTRRVAAAGIRLNRPFRPMLAEQARPPPLG